MVGIKCNNSNEVKNVVKKLIFINEIKEEVADTLMRDILTETCKGGYPVIIVKDFKDIKISYNIESNIDIIPYKEYTVLNLFKKNGFKTHITIHDVFKRVIKKRINQ